VVVKATVVKVTIVGGRPRVTKMVDVTTEDCAWATVSCHGNGKLATATARKRDGLVLDAATVSYSDRCYLYIGL